MRKNLFKDEEYRFVSTHNKEFILDFGAEIDRLGDTRSQTIGDGYRWGRKMIM